MGLDKTDVVRIPEFEDENIPGSGFYTQDELSAYCRRASRFVAEQLSALGKLEQLVEISNLDVSDESQEDQTAFEEGNIVAHKVLSRELRKAVRKTLRNSPQDLRDNYLQSLVDDFDSLASEPGFLNLDDTGMSRKLFRRLDTDGDNKLSVAELVAGITPP